MAIKSMIAPMQFWRGIRTFGSIALAVAGGPSLRSVAQTNAVAETSPSSPAAAVPGSTQSPLADRPDWKKLAAFSRALTREEFEAAFKDFYSDGSAFPAPWTLESDGVSVNTGDLAKPSVRIAFRNTNEPAPPLRRYWRTVNELPPRGKRPLLSDVHIAIDPGHIGGSYAKIEERLLSFSPGEAVQEGDLTLLAAQIMKPRLQALGAHVTLVREQPAPVTEMRPDDFKSLASKILQDAGVQSPKETYDGIAGDEKVLTVQWQSEKLFYRVSEIRARAKRVNEVIKPDLVVCLHLNAEAWGDATTPQFSPMNHLHVLVNGCYPPQELALDDVRFEMLERLLSRMHEIELPLAESVARSMAEATSLPPYVYTTPNARRVGSNHHVYARNLLANRLYRCPVVYVEPFVMNHQDTYHRLLLGHYVGRTLLNGRLQRSAIEDYARGIVDGLVSYYKSRRAP